MGKASNYIPALRYGNKIMPEDIAGIVGLPSVGNIYYVDATSGSDTANSGTSQEEALATVAAAYDKCVSGNHDVVLIAPSGGTGRTSETTAITWAKRFTHLIGNSAPTYQDARAGINFGTGGSLSITENGCIFKNITFAGTADINVPVTITGDYNAFIGVDFKGSLNATTGDDTAARALYINGGQENTFVGCTFGADTYNRSAANATVEFASNASRNIFADCRFLEATDATTPVHILFTGAAAIDRWIEFRDCLFYNFTESNLAEPAAVMNLADQVTTGHVLLTGNCQLHHIDNWEATASGNISYASFSTTANAVGKPINPTVD
jgi:hypothetical protein